MVVTGGIARAIYPRRRLDARGCREAHHPIQTKTRAKSPPPTGAPPRVTPSSVVLRPRAELRPRILAGAVRKTEGQARFDTRQPSRRPVGMARFCSSGVPPRFAAASRMHI